MKKIIFIILFIILLAAIPLTIYISKQRQELRSIAAPSSTLSLQPASLTRQVGDIISFDVNLDTGENEVLFAAIQLSYDTSKLEALSVVNGSIFPNISNAGTIDATRPAGKASIGVGVSDVNTPFKGQGTVAVLKFKALAPTTQQIAIEFDRPPTYVGSDPSKEPTYDVLTQALPAKITITGDVQATPSPTVIDTPVLTPTDTASESGTPTPTTSVSQQTNPPNSNVSITTPNGETATSSQPAIKGTAPAGSTVTITIYSTPITAIVTADGNGNWVYIPNEQLTAGPHDITVTANDPTTGSSYTTSSSFVVASGGNSSTQSAVLTAGNISTTVVCITLGILLIITGLIIQPLTKI